MWWGGAWGWGGGGAARAPRAQVWGLTHSVWQSDFSCSTWLCGCWQHLALSTGPSCRPQSLFMLSGGRGVWGGCILWSIPPPQAQEPSSEMGHVLSPGTRAQPSSLFLAWTFCSNSVIAASQSVCPQLLDDRNCVSFISASLCLTQGGTSIAVCC